ncbi:MAG: lytic transglycosylase domain-containing protein [Ilumatobacter sp.]|uniref:lytic transglycosylase domain-containing protein n=1 Tax=Ilumatobacter sp. TaxID=1967498 RepID=UPI0039196FA7
MTISPVAGIMARIATIESRFGVEPPSTPLDQPASTPGVVASSASSEFDAVLDTAMAAALRTGPIGSVAVPWSSLPGGAAWSGASASSVRTGAATPSWGPTASVTEATPAGSPGLVVPSSGPVALESLDARPVAPGTPFAELFDAAGARHGVPPRLLASIGWVESRYQTDVVSPDGAVGVMQLMPFVAEHYGVDARVPAQAIDAAAQLLAEHRERFGDWELSVASYFSGAGAVSRAGNVPPTTRSHDYVRNVTERLAFT